MKRTEDDESTGCLLCVHGKFVPGPPPQKVECKEFGLVDERRECPKFKGQPIQEIDPQ